MCRPWGIRLTRERNEVCINPKGIPPLVTLSAGRERGVACRFGFTNFDTLVIRRVNGITAFSDYLINLSEVQVLMGR